MACNHDYILITFDYLKIIYKPFKRFNTLFVRFCKNYLKSEKFSLLIYFLHLWFYIKSV